MLHDVGKIGIEDHILKKNGVLTNEEYEIMKLHPVIGADILTPIGALREMLPAVRWHHESWNGRGYPDGLKGEEIPLIARIVAVADTFDAITTNRPYQNAYSAEYGVETITKLTGARFDAKVVTAFLRAFETGSIKVEAPSADAGTAAVRRVALSAMPFQYIMANLLAETRAIGVLFLDETGETVDVACSDFTPYDMKVLGAYLGIYLRQIGDFLASNEMGAPEVIHIEKEQLHIFRDPAARRVLPRARPAPSRGVGPLPPPPSDGGARARGAAVHLIPALGRWRGPRSAPAEGVQARTSW